MADPVQDYLKKQDASVAASFFDIDWCNCAAISHAELHPLTGRDNVILVPLPPYGPTEAIVVRHDGFPELWCRAKRGDYNSPFLAFLKQEYGISWGNVPSNYNVDHLFSHKRVGKDAGDAESGNKLPPETMVRLLLVSEPVNKSYGRLMEADMVGSGNRLRRVRRFTYLQLAKALGINANSFGGGFAGPNRAANFWHIVDEFERRGILDEINLGREQMMVHLQDMAEVVLHFRALRKKKT